jgi:hypothetical protein
MNLQVLRDSRGISNVIVVMLSLILIVIIVSNVAYRFFQMNEIDWERLREDISIANVTQVEKTWSYNPSGYALGGSTSLVSGSISDLTSNDSIYMVFRSYASATSNIVTNGNVTTPTDWTYTDISDPNSVVSGGYSNTTYHSKPYSLYIRLVDNSARDAYSGSGKQYQIMMNLSTLPLSATLHFYYRIDCEGISGISKGETANATVVITKPGGYSVTVFTTSVTFNTSETVNWTYETIDVSNVFTETGTYILNLQAYFSTTGKGKPTLTVYYDDVWLIIVTPTEFTSEVEFTGTSNTRYWTRIIWTVDSAWTIDNVTVTLQLFNYTLNDYPTSGNGYIAYTSSSTPNTDETVSQTISVNPDDFRNATGYWKMRIRGVKATNTQFDLKVDWIELKVFSEGTLFTIKNKGPLTSRLVSLWIINSTNHIRYDIDIIINSGETLPYFRGDIRLPQGKWMVKVVTQRGNTAIFTKDD